MADVSRDGRGQRLLVGAALLGGRSVGLAPVVKSAILAGTLATREGDSAGSDARSFRSTAMAGVAGTLASTNRDGAGESFVTLRDGRYQPRVRAPADRLASSRSLDGVAVNLSATDSRPDTTRVSGTSADDRLSVTGPDDAGDDDAITVAASGGTHDRSGAVIHVADDDGSGCHQ